jgi:DNA-binding MarR family transcriptional regulator
LDRFEFDPAAWVWKIKELAKWQKAEALVLPGQRGPGKKSEWRIRMAVGLAEEGKRQSQIAERLNIRSSTISNWIKRGQAPELARILASQRRLVKKSRTTDTK